MQDEAAKRRFFFFVFFSTVYRTNTVNRLRRIKIAVPCFRFSAYDIPYSHYCHFRRSNKRRAHHYTSIILPSCLRSRCESVSSRREP